MKLIGTQLTHREDTCQRKVRYRTLKRCMNAINTIKKIRSVQIKGFKSEAYHCSICDGWHTGTKSLQ